MNKFIQILKEKKLLAFAVAALFMIISVALSFGTYKYTTGGFLDILSRLKKSR